MVSLPILSRGSFIQAPCVFVSVLWVIGLPTFLMVVQLLAAKRINNSLYHPKANSALNKNKYQSFSQCSLVFMISFLAHLSRMAHPLSISLSLCHSFSPPSPHHLTVVVVICFSLVLLLLLTLSPLTNALSPSTPSATAFTPAHSS